ncbi:hypothetical protein A9K55_002996 [Cordyceps militaris]|uniref:Uncharacterized protein n=1 Tax=Cordyceps militaris TaxID=73501 RepID=A0A2H4S5S5_CORMI|nr:hypothetical protein A9K55_002996 [Cordyceps militaris]
MRLSLYTTAVSAMLAGASAAGLQVCLSAAPASLCFGTSIKVPELCVPVAVPPAALSYKIDAACGQCTFYSEFKCVGAAFTATGPAQGTLPGAIKSVKCTQAC